MGEFIGQITQSFVAGRDASHVVQLAGNHNVILVVTGENRRLQHLAPAGSPRVPSTMGANPYRSLDSFDETSSDLFFGRAALSGKLMSRLERLARADADVDAPLRFMAIVGPSGCGKSSIAKAGLVPAVAHSEAEALRNAQVLAFRPGRQPLAALAAVLVRRSPELETANVEAGLRRAGTSGQFSDLTEATPFPDGVRRAMILVVDQFEEIYSQSKPPDGKDDGAGEAARLERSIFARTLLAAARAPDSKIFVVLTVRSDFLAAVGEHQDVSAAIAANHELVPPMDRAELTEAIGRPAALRGFPLHQAVVDSLAAQALESPSALPLVQLALFRFWKTVADAADEGGEAAAYQALGDLGGTIATSAREVMAELPSENARELAWRVLLRAVQIGNGIRDTRRRVLFSEVLAKGTSLAAVQAAVAPFVRERLLSTGGDFGGAAGDWIEITHEALILNWDDLRERLDQERSAEILSRRVQEAAERWQKGEGDLWRGVDLSRLKEHAAIHRLTASEANYLDASKSAERKRRWGTAAAIGLVAVVVLGGVGGGFLIRMSISIQN